MDNNHDDHATKIISQAISSPNHPDHSEVTVHRPEEFKTLSHQRLALKNRIINKMIMKKSTIDQLEKTLQDTKEALLKGPALTDKKPDSETESFLNSFSPKNTHPKDPMAGMPDSTASGQKTTPTGFKLKLVKALADAGHRESALLLKNWGEYDKTADMMKSELEKSNYGPKDMNLYSPTDNAQRKARNTGDSYTDIGQNKNSKAYTTTSSSSQKASEANQQKAQDIKAKTSLKTMDSFSPEQIKAMEAKANK